MRRALVMMLCGVLAGGGAAAAPIVPRHDGEVVETLPASPERAEDRRLARALAQQPADPALALRVARRYLERARADGDPRHAGRALGALAAWRDVPDPPVEVALMQATLQQHLHDFEGAAQRLQVALAREPKQPQAWLTLATVRRVQGRYADSDTACGRLLSLGATTYGKACGAENDALRGRVDTARDAFHALLAQSRDDAQRGWLLTSLGEIEQRAGAPVAAESAYRSALRDAPDLYTALAYADLLLEQRRDAEVPALLQPWPRSDAVLLRLALSRPGGAEAAELRARIAQANLRPSTAALHGREQAMFALGVERQPARALQLARDNVREQREPVDLLVFARAARASGDPRALEEVRSLIHEIGLHDRRIDALL